MKYLLTILTFFYFQTSGLPQNQQGEDSCLAYVRQLYQDIRQKMNINRDKVFYLKLEIETTTGKGTDQVTHRSLASLQANKHKSVFLSEAIKVYQDTLTTISIIPDKKLIYLMDSQHRKQKAVLQYLTPFQDSLFSMSGTVHCQEVVLKDGACGKKIKLQVNPQGQRLFHVNTMEFLIDEQKNLIVCSQVKYVEGFHMNQIKVSFLDIDFDHSSTSLDCDFLSLIFDSRGKWQNSYQDYQLMDSRQRE